MMPIAFVEQIPDTVRMDAALARLLRQPASTAPAGGPAEGPLDRSWGWMDAAMPVAGLEITEHLLPEGVDFATFQRLLGALH